MSDDVCHVCGDLKDEVGSCYTCSDEHIDLRKDFVWEYGHESITQKDTQFRKILPFYEDF